MKPTQTEIDEVLNKCSESEDSGITDFPGMTYEQGVKTTIEWLQGNDTTNPLSE